MNVSSYSIHSGADIAYGRAARVSPEGQGRSRGRGDFASEQADTARVQAGAATSEASESRAVVPVLELVSASQRRPQVYPIEDLSRYTVSQRKALETYTANQGLSRLDPNADYLGAIDTYA